MLHCPTFPPISIHQLVLCGCGLFDPGIAQHHFQLKSSGGYHSLPFSFLSLGVVEHQPVIITVLFGDLVSPSHHHAEPHCRPSSHGQANRLQQHHSPCCQSLEAFACNHCNALRSTRPTSSSNPTASGCHRPIPPPSSILVRQPPQTTCKRPAPHRQRHQLRCHGATDRTGNGVHHVDPERSGRGRQCRGPRSHDRRCCAAPAC